MRKLAIVLSIALLGTFLFSGTVLAKDPKDVQIVYIVKDLVNPFFVEMKWGGAAAALEHGVKYTCLAPERYSVETRFALWKTPSSRKWTAS